MEQEVVGELEKKGKSNSKKDLNLASPNINWNKPWNLKDLSLLLSKIIILYFKVAGEPKKYDIGVRSGIQIGTNLLFLQRCFNIMCEELNNLFLRWQEAHKLLIKLKPQKNLWTVEKEIKHPLLKCSFTGCQNHLQVISSS